MQKPGYKTTEFWLTLVATLISFLVASGVLDPGSTALQIATGISGFLATLGYQGCRALTKSSENKLAAVRATTQAGGDPTSASADA